jgi:hypothetical protein
VNVTLASAAIAGGMLTALVAAGCGAQAAGQQGTVQACANYGVRAIEQHIMVTRKPAACEGLSRAQVNLAVGQAIYRVAGGRPKAAWRRAAAQASVWLVHLVSPPQDTAIPPPGSAIAGSSAPPRPGSDTALSFAALGAWILAAGSGSYILGGWIAHGGLRRLRAGGAGRAGGTGLSPAVIFGHFALAAAGLLVWIGYLATDEAGLAWAAVGMLLPVAGLGMAMVTIGLSGERADAVAAAGSITAVGSRTTQAAPARPRMPVLVVVGHGLLAVSTILLVLLAALGAPGS